MKIVDTRINNNHSMKWYNELANEYLQKMGREVNGGCEMSGTEFRTGSYAKDRNEKQLTVIINYKEQTIEII